MAPMTPYYFSHSKCGKVRIITAPFGYGPRVAAETMVKLLNLTIDDWQLNSVTTKKTTFKVTLNFGVSQPVNEPETSFKIWIDCLMWLRNNIPQEVADYDLFLAENFFKTNPFLLKQIPESKSKDITPLYSLNGYSSFSRLKNIQNQDGYILVSFGGIETPYTTDIHRFAIPRVVLESLIFASGKLDDKRKIICCLPLHIRKQLQQNPSFSKIHFLSPTHEEFLSILKTASIYVVQPGLYGPFEAFENNIPTVFMTPFSYTQVCQARVYDRENLAEYIPMWSLLNSEIGNMCGDIINEEEICFKNITNFIEKYINSNFPDTYFNWAQMVLRNEIVTSDLINKRKQYIVKCKSIKAYQLHKIQKIIL